MFHLEIDCLYSLVQAIEQARYEAGKEAQSPAQPILPPTSSLPSNPGTFFSGAAVQVMAHPGSPFVIPEGNSSRAGNYSFNANVLPKQTDQSQQTVCFSLSSFSFLDYCHAGY